MVSVQSLIQSRDCGRTFNQEPTNIETKKRSHENYRLLPIDINLAILFQEYVFYWTPTYFRILQTSLYIYIFFV